MRNKMFLDLHGIPYVLGEYFNAQNLRQVDRTLIKNHFLINNNEAYRAVFDISIDDIGRRASDNTPAVMGNRSKQKALVNMVERNAIKVNHVLDVIKKGIVVRVNYRLEDRDIGAIIRSASEDLYIPARNYFVDIASDLNDNALVTNFKDSIVSTLNNFTHGTNRTILRVTSIQLFYRVASKVNCNTPGCPTSYFNPYYHHQQYQSHINLTGNNPIGEILPPSWWSFNKFYHFDKMGSDLVLHEQQINDPATESILIPCGTVTVNRSFEINPGHRIVFNISVWKNDITVIENTTLIAKALGTHALDYPCQCHEELLELLRRLLQNQPPADWNALTNEIRRLIQAIENIDCNCGTPTPPPSNNNPPSSDTTDPLNPNNPNNQGNTDPGNGTDSGNGTPPSTGNDSSDPNTGGSGGNSSGPGNSGTPGTPPSQDGDNQNPGGTTPGQGDNQDNVPGGQGDNGGPSAPGGSGGTNPGQNSGDNSPGNTQQPEPGQSGGGSGGDSSNPGSSGNDSSGPSQPGGGTGGDSSDPGSSNPPSQGNTGDGQDTGPSQPGGGTGQDGSGDSGGGTGGDEEDAEPIPDEDIDDLFGDLP